jgi:hypothetical protein
VVIRAISLVKKPVSAGTPQDKPMDNGLVTVAVNVTGGCGSAIASWYVGVEAGPLPAELVAMMRTWYVLP